jgi:methylmalonyl-CoA epimerase
MNLFQIDHIGIAVPSIEAALPFYQSTLGLSVIHDEVIQDQQVRAVFIKVGESTVEPDSPIAIFLQKKGPGMHHIAYAVADIEQKLAEAKSAGFRLIDEKPRPGGHGKIIAFLHPKDTFGVLTELCQRID